MPSRPSILALVLAGLVAGGCSGTESASTLQCYKDTDCKAERICEQGRCTQPPPSTTLPEIEPAAASPMPPTPAPAPAPRFEDYPAAPLYQGPGADLADKQDPFRTRNQQALQHNDIVFASEYVISTVGCGTSCVIQTFLSKRTGQQLRDGFGGEDGEKIQAVRPDSRLVVTAGKNDEEPNDPGYYAYYYVLENQRLRRIGKHPTQFSECGQTDYCSVPTPY